MNEFIIYTDGSSRGNPGPGGWAAIIMQNAKGKTRNEETGMENKEIRKENWSASVREIGGREEHTTNNRMELKAAIEGLKAVPTGSKIDLVADSEYVVKGITIWIKNWLVRKWRTADKKPVLNQDLWQELLKATESKDINWKVVRGHAGIKHNERADVIATSFADNVPVELRAR
jgi:ribonuclease HI